MIAKSKSVVGHLVRVLGVSTSGYILDNSLSKFITDPYVSVCFLSFFVILISSSYINLAIAFKSECQNNVYRHIILACRHKGKWGAIGLSRKEDLMYKPMGFASLGDLIKDFLDSYVRSAYFLKG